VFRLEAKCEAPPNEYPNPNVLLFLEIKIEAGANIATQLGST